MTQHSHSRCFPKRNKAIDDHMKTCTQMFIVVLFLVAKNVK